MIEIFYKIRAKVYSDTKKLHQENCHLAKGHLIGIFLKLRWTISIIYISLIIQIYNLNAELYFC